MLQNNLQFILTLIFCLSFFQLKAQEKAFEKPPIISQSSTKIKGYLFGIGIEREQKINDNQVIYLIASVKSVSPFRKEEPHLFSFQNLINAAPVFSFGYRKFYYAKEWKRKTQTKLTNTFPSFYGFEYNLIAPVIFDTKFEKTNVHAISPTIGFQKKLNEKKSFEFTLGPSLQTDFLDYRITLLFRLGWNYNL